MKYIIASILLSIGTLFMAAVFAIGGLAMLYSDFKEHKRIKRIRRIIFKLYHKTRRKHIFINTKYLNLNYNIPPDKEFFIWD
jgi:hypothetical protein